jgi:excisionase family DNA binding protein
VNTNDRLLTVDEAAERLGTGVRFIRRLVQERRIRYAKIGQRADRVRRGEHRPHPP